MNFCCISDYNYCYKVITLNQSLSKVMDNYNLIIYCLDDKIYNYLYDLNLNNIQLVKISSINNPRFKETINNRSWVEYIWTATPQIIKHCLESYKDDCVYLDSDLFFYKNPLSDINIDQNFDVLITPHNFSNKFMHLQKFGKYCVQYIYFRNSKFSHKILAEWANECIEWCYARYENGKFGDQKYLENWPIKYNSKVYVSNHNSYLGPWNIDDYQIKANKLLYKQKDIVEPIFYHFHNLNFISSQKVDIGNFNIKNEIINKFYMDYINLAKINYDQVNKHSKINIYKDFRNLKNFFKRIFKISKNQYINL